MGAWYCTNPWVPVVPRVSFDTARFTVRVRVYPAAGTVYNGMGAVWQKPTRGIHVLNPMQDLVLIPGFSS